MALTAPPVIPQITDPATFATRSQDWVVWQAESFYPFLEDGASLIGLSTSGTSTTSNTIGTGSKTFTVEAGKGFVNGMSLSIARTSAPTNRMFAVVTSYSGTILQVTSQAFEGSGTFTDWSIAIAVNGIVTTAQIQDEAVTLPKLAPGAKTSKIQDVEATVASNNLTLTSAPVVLDFRSTTLTDGTPVTRTLSSASSLVVPNGATLGTTNGVQARLVKGLIDNAGTLEEFVINSAGGNNLDETTLISTTAISTASDSANVFYSTTARSNVAFRVNGFVDITEATAGLWATPPTLVQGTGGQAQIRSYSQIRLNTSNGYGSTNTRILRYTNIVRNVGSDITYADSATLGASITINTPGIYSISGNYANAGAGGHFGFSLNSTQLTTALASINVTDILTVSSCGNSNSLSVYAAFTGYFNSGDVIRPHTDGAGTAGANFGHLNITRIS